MVGREWRSLSSLSGRLTAKAPLFWCSGDQNLISEGLRQGSVSRWVRSIELGWFCREMFLFVCWQCLTVGQWKGHQCFAQMLRELRRS